MIFISKFVVSFVFSASVGLPTKVTAAPIVWPSFILYSRYKNKLSYVESINCNFRKTLLFTLRPMRPRKIMMIYEISSFNVWNMYSLYPRQIYRSI